MPLFALAGLVGHRFVFDDHVSGTAIGYWAALGALAAVGSYFVSRFAKRNAERS